VILDEYIPTIVGDQIEINIMISDVGSDDLNFTYDWGDGTGPIFGGQFYNNGTNPDPYTSALWGKAPFNIKQTLYHIYNKPGEYNANFSIYDDDGGHINATVQVKVLGAKGFKEEAVKLLEPLVPGRWDIIGYRNVTLKYLGEENVTILAYNYISQMPFGWEQKLIYTYCNVTKDSEIFVDASELPGGKFGNKLILMVYNDSRYVIEETEISTVYSCLDHLKKGQIYGNFELVEIGELEGTTYKHFSRYALRVEDAMDSILFSLNRDPRRGYGWWHMHWVYYCDYWIMRELWVDDARLDPEFGTIVFCEERSATQNLMEVINNCLMAIGVHNMTLMWDGNEKVDIEVYQLGGMWDSEWNLTDTFLELSPGDRFFIGYKDDFNRSSYVLGKRILIKVYKYSNGELLDAAYIRTSGYWPLEVEPGNSYGNLVIISSTIRTTWGNYIQWGYWGIRGKGFWKHQFRTALDIINGYQHVPTRALEYYLCIINESTSLSDLKYLGLWDALNILESNSSDDMYDKAIEHLLSTWFNLITTGDQLVDIDNDGNADMLLSTAIEYFESILNNPSSNDDDYADVKNMCENINEFTNNINYNLPFLGIWRPWYGDYSLFDSLEWETSRGCEINYNDKKCWNETEAENEKMRICSNLTAIKLAIKYLVLADDIIAKVAYMDATNITVQNSSNQEEYAYHLKMAKRYLLRARREGNRGRPHRAISDFKLSWKNSILAAKWAMKSNEDPNSTPDPGEGEIWVDWDIECLGNPCCSSGFGPWWLPLQGFLEDQYRQASRDNTW
jgi:hypothetical protein